MRPISEKLRIQFKPKHLLCAAIVLIFFRVILLLYSSNLGPLLEFVKAGGNYDALRMTYSQISTPLLIDRTIPSNAMYELSDADWHFNRIAAQYFLYPRETSSDWDYYVALDRQKPDVPDLGRQIELSSGPMVYTREGGRFVCQKKTKGYYHLGRSLAYWTVVQIFCGIIGFYFLTIMCVPSQPAGRLWFLSTAYLSGMFLVNAVIWVLMLGGAPMNRVLVLIVWTGLVVVLGLGAMRVRRRPSPMLSEKGVCLDRKPHSKIGQMFGLIMGLTVVYIAVSIAATPVTQWDPMAYWIMKAKVFFHQQSFHMEYTRLNFYPLIWPLYIATQMVMQGTSYDAVASWSTALAFLAFIGQFIGAQRVLRLEKLWFWVPLMMFIVYFVTWNTYSSSAENIFLAYLMSVLTMILMWLRNPSDRRWFYMALFLALALSLVKFEGFVALLIIGGALTLVRPCGETFRRSLRWIGIFALPSVVIFGWLLWTKKMGYTDSVSHFAGGFQWEKVAVIGKLWWVHVAQLRSSYLLMGMIMLSMFVIPRRNWEKSEAFLGFVYLGLAVFSYISIIGWPVDSLANQFKVASLRLYLHAAPALVLCWAGRLLGRVDQVQVSKV